MRCLKVVKHFKLHKNKFEELTLPIEPNDNSLYHSLCHKNFLKINGIYYKRYSAEGHRLENLEAHEDSHNDDEFVGEERADIELDPTSDSNWERSSSVENIADESVDRDFQFLSDEDSDDDPDYDPDAQNEMR